MAYCKRLHEHEKALFEERLQNEQRGRLLAMQKTLKDQEKKTLLTMNSAHQNSEARNSTQQNQGQHKSTAMLTAAAPSSSRGDLSSASLPHAMSVHPPLKAGREDVIMASLMSNSGMMPSTNALGRMSGYDAAPALNAIDLREKYASLQCGPNISAISKELQLLSETQAKIATLPTDLASNSSLTSRLYTQLSPTLKNIKSLATTATESIGSHPFGELTKEHSSVPATRESSEISKADQDAVNALAALASKRPDSTSVTGGPTVNVRDSKDVNSDKPSFLEKIRMAEVPADDPSEHGNKKSKKKTKEKARTPGNVMKTSMKLSDDAVLRKAAWLTNRPLAKSTAARVAVDAHEMYPHVAGGFIPPQSSLLHNIQLSSVPERPALQLSRQPPLRLSAPFPPSRPVKSSLSASTIERLAVQINNQPKRTAAEAFAQENSNDIGAAHSTSPLTAMMLPDQRQLLRTNDIQQMMMLAEAEELQRRIAVAEMIARREKIAASSVPHHLAVLGGATVARGVGSVPELGLATVSMKNAANISTANSGVKNETTDDTQAALEFAARYSKEFQQYKKLRHS